MSLKVGDKVRVVQILGTMANNTPITNTLNKIGEVIKVQSTCCRVLFSPEGEAYTYFMEEVEKC